MEVIGHDLQIHAAETASFDDSPQEHQLEADLCNRIAEARGSDCRRGHENVRVDWGAWGIFTRGFESA
jgi:hypothetical protein